MSDFSSYQFEDYTDNWSNWQNQFPNIPLGVNGDVGFAVPNSDGTLNPSYPITPGPNSPAQPGCNGLAIGGWTASQEGGGLYEILTQELQGGQLTPAQNTLIQSILNAAKQNGYTNVILDYENYYQPHPSGTPGPPAPDPQIYTAFLEKLGQVLHQAGITLEMAMSPSLKNQGAYDLLPLVNSGAVDHFQVMCYDYALGQGSPVKVEANSGIEQTYHFLSALKSVIPPSKMTIGVALYGVSYNVQPGMSVAQIEAALQDGTLQGSYSDPNSPTISDDDILKQIGSWTNPNSPWQLVNDGHSPPNYFYYNAGTGTIYSAFPPQSMQDFANMIQSNFPTVAGFFSWDADDDRSGTMMQTLVNDFIGNTPPSVSTCVSEIEQWLDGLKGASATWISQMQDHLKNDPPTTLSELTNWLQGVFNSTSSDQDVYMQSGLLLASPMGNVINQLKGLFSQFPNLLPLNLSIPEPTFADIAYAQALAWEPDSQGGKNLKTALLQQLEQEGSNYPKASLDSWAYQLNPTVYAGMSSTDSAAFTNITGAWL